MIVMRVVKRTEGAGFRGCSLVGGFTFILKHCGCSFPAVLSVSWGYPRPTFLLSSCGLLRYEFRDVFGVRDYLCVDAVRIVGAWVLCDSVFLSGMS